MARYCFHLGEREALEAAAKQERGETKKKMVEWVDIGLLQTA